MGEEINPPAYQMEGVDVVDILLPLVHLSLDPMSIQIAEEMVDVLGRSRVSIPFSDVEGQQGLIRVGLRLIVDGLEMVGEVRDEVVVQIFAEKVSCGMSARGFVIRCRQGDLDTSTMCPAARVARRRVDGFL